MHILKAIFSKLVIFSSYIEPYCKSCLFDVFFPLVWNKHIMKNQKSPKSQTWQVHEKIFVFSPAVSPLKNMQVCTKEYLY